MKRVKLSQAEKNRANIGRSLPWRSMRSAWSAALLRTLTFFLIVGTTWAQDDALPVQQANDPRFIPDKNEVIVLQGKELTRQTGIYLYYPSLSGGALRVGKGKTALRSMLRIDIDRISALGEVKDAVLMLNVSGGKNTAHGFTFGVFPLKTEWIEGEASWFRPGNGLSWKGGAFDREPVGTVKLKPSTRLNWVVVRSPEFTALVNEWLTKKRKNKGVALIALDEFNDNPRTSRRFFGKTTGKTAPKLVLSYRDPIDPIRFGAGAGFRIQPFQGEDLPNKMKGDSVRLNRDINNLCARIDKAAKRLYNPAAMDPVKKLVRDAFAKLDRKLTPETLASTQKMLQVEGGKWLAAAWRLLFPRKHLLVLPASPFERLDPRYVPGTKRGVKVDRTVSITSLQGEYQAAGIMVANLTDSPSDCRITVEGLPTNAFDIVIRKQVLMENWYEREQSLIADPLPLLASKDGAYILPLAPGETAKLCVVLHHVSNKVGTWPAVIKFALTEKEPVTLPMNVTVLQPKLPEDTGFAHFQFMYFVHKSVRIHGRVMAKDLREHSVKGVELALRPSAKFTPEGEFVRANFKHYEKILKKFGADVPLFVIFWGEATSPLRATDGTKLIYPSPAHNTATIALLRAWLKRAAELGYGSERFAYMFSDEPQSSSLAKSPSQAVLDLARIAKRLKGELPELKLACTFSYYTYPEDAYLLIPWVDIAIPTYPMPERLMGKYAPADYSPKRVFAKKIYPKLEIERKKRGVEIWSYHISSGKSDNVLAFNRLYPLVAIAKGYTGVSHWAYNIYKGSSWHEWDGGGIGLDYSMIYDGLEDNPLCKKVNVTREPIVPSIRWEALRIGIQDAKLLLALKQAERKGVLDQKTSTSVNACLGLLRAVDAGTHAPLTFKGVDKISVKLRRIYAATLSGGNGKQ